MIIHGDCLQKMQEITDCSIDFIVTDPPYGIKFLSKDFDKFKDQPAFNSEYWKEALRICKPGSMLAAFGGDRTHHHLMNALENAGWEIKTCIYWITGQGFPKSLNKFGLEGYGTALKPAAEIIVLCMKKLDGTYAQNAEKWGIGGINIEFSRVFSPHHENDPQKKSSGRWPANLLLSEKAAEMLDQQSGISRSKIGGVSRFFYCVKASSSERNAGLGGMAKGPPVNIGRSKPDIGRKDPKSYLRENYHPTVKPLSLMRYLIKLLAPPGNPTLLDPFMGSGSTLIAAKQLGINAIGIELNDEYCEIARKRVDHWQLLKNDQLDLFND